MRGKTLVLKCCWATALLKIKFFLMYSLQTFLKELLNGCFRNKAHFIRILIALRRRFKCLGMLVFKFKLRG